MRAYIKPETIRSSRRASIIAAVFAGAISLAGLGGWASRVHSLALVAIHPVIAFGFVLASASILLLHRDHSEKMGSRLGGILAGSVVFIGALTLISHWFHWNLEIDGWVLPKQLGANSVPPKAALALMLIGGALLFQRTARAYRFAELFSFFAVGIGVVGLQGYAFGLLDLFTDPSFIPMFIGTGVGLTALGIAILLARPERGAIGIIASDTAGGFVARRLLPMAIIVPMGLGALRLAGENAGWYSTKFGVALFTTAFIVLFLALIWWTARLLHRLDLKRRAAESAIQNSEERVRRLNLELEHRFAERTAALEAANAANEDLESFSYSVSHDLRAPLRAIGGFSRIVIEDHSATMDADGVRYLHQVEKSAQQMGQLIDDLLTFSRTGRQELKVQKVSTRSVVKAALEDLKTMREDRRVDICVGELPDCDADPSLLRQVWLNLLANALKYTSKKDPAVITIGSRREGGTDVFFVRDNGAGFDMKYAGKLFGVFQRLHLADDYEGTGVGLALVQRIVQRHGGRVWTEAEVNRGATFYFTLTGGPSA
ncbi:MAG: ATP-binding protein [Verrucomicrobiota bacterium]|nr:ATP-binding protein [Verrucomicrobiota bacterium]